MGRQKKEHITTVLQVELKQTTISGNLNMSDANARRFKTILNWSLYGKSNEEEFEMLRKAFRKLMNLGWKNNMPNDEF